MAELGVKEQVEGAVIGALDAQHELQKLESELMQTEAFQQFIKLRNAVNTKMAEVRKHVEEVMVLAYTQGKVDKSIKGDWGSVTVTERDDFDINELELPAKFWKKVPDTTKIRGTYQLEGKAPKGTTQTKRYGIMIKFKEQQ